MAQVFENMKIHIQNSQIKAYLGLRKIKDKLFERAHLLFGKEIKSFFEITLNTRVYYAFRRHMRKIRKFKTIFYEKLNKAKKECTNLIESGAQYKDISKYFNEFYHVYELHFRYFMKLVIIQVRLCRYVYREMNILIKNKA